MIGKRMLSLLLLSVLLLSLSSPAFAEEGRDLSGGSLDVEGGVFIYNGSPQRPSVTLTLNGEELALNADYTLSYEDNTDAGTATVIATGTGSYSGTCSATFSIQPRAISTDDLSFRSPCVKEYDGTTTATPTLAAKVLSGDSVTVTYTGASFDDRYSGTGKRVTAWGIQLSGADSGNYTLSGDTLLTDDRGQITPKQPRFPATASLTQGGQTLDFSELVEGVPEGTLTIAPEGDALGCTTSGSVLTSGDQAGTISLLLDACGRDINGDGQPEYDSARTTVTVTITQRQSQEDLSITGPATGSGTTTTASGGTQSTATTSRTQPNLSLSGSTTMIYGETLQLSTTGGGGTGSVTYKVTNYTGEATVDSTGLLTAKKAGTVLVSAEKAGDETYAPAKAEGVYVTIKPAAVTIQVGSKTARVGDALPTLTSRDYTVTGLVGSDTLQTQPTLFYASTPTMTKAEKVTISASGAVVPAGGNYNSNIVYKTGTLTVQEEPVYGISLASYANGTLTSSTQAATEGTTVTVTAAPTEGYHLESLTVTGEDGSKPTVTLSGSTGTFVMPGASVKVTASFVSDTAAVTLPFEDVTQGDWFYESVAYAYSKGLMTGTSDTAFSPQGTVTRGMLVTILYRLGGSPEPPAWSPFSDVGSGKYYASAVAWAAWNGIVNGTTATTFQPDAAVTREQLAAILYRYADFQGYDVTTQGDLTSFRDLAQLHSYAETAMSWANGTGLITGKSSIRLDPQGTATRAETAAILQRFCSRFLS